MNRIYRTLWSVATQSWQAVPETAKSAGKKSKSSAGGVLASVALGIGLSGGANAQSPPAVNQLPTGGSVARGTATISQTATAQAATMTVNQSSQRAVINWNTFNVGSNASVNFVQPNAQAVTLNRVNDSNPSQIFGRISANGQVFLTNANGVYFSRTSSVDVGAFTATTHSITDDNFMSGNYVFERNGATGKIINEGNITAALGGYVALLAPEVQNAGVVVARAGTVAMAAGETITLNFDGVGGLAGITTTPSAIASLIENKLAVQAPEGQIILSAVALNKLQMGLIKNSGTIEANSLVNKGGKIYLEGDSITLESNSKIEAKGPLGGGTVLVGGDWQGSGTLRQATKVTMEAGSTIDASATDNGDGGKVVLWSDVHNADSVTQVNGSINAKAGLNSGNGGKVETSGHQLNVDKIQVSTQATKGVTGEFLLDPTDFTVAASGGDMTGTALGTLLGSNSITIYSGSGTNTATSYYGATGGTAGDINVNDAVSWSSATKLTLNAQGNINVNAVITATGSATLDLYYGQGAPAANNTSVITMKMGAKNNWDGKINLPAGTNKFQTKQGSDGTLKAYTVINNITDLQALGVSPTGNYVLGADIDALATSGWNITSGVAAGFIPLARATAYAGTFDGLGHSISDLYINTALNSTGLFGKVQGGAVVQNVGMVFENINSSSYAIGGLVGSAQGITGQIIIRNAFTTGDIQSTHTGGPYAGGLLGMSQAANLKVIGTYSTANVSAQSGNLGGLIGGINYGGAAVGSSEIKNNYAAGNVTAPLTLGGNSNKNVGGLIGYLAFYDTTGGGSSIGIYDNFATGNVTSYNLVGGLIGTILYVGGSQPTRATISQNFSSGLVTFAGGTLYAGGMLGGTSAPITAVVSSNNYWNTDTSGKTNGVGQGPTLFTATGITAAVISNSSNSNFSGFVFTSSTPVWINTTTGPYLAQLPLPYIPKHIYLLAVSGQSSTYGTAPTTLSYCFSSTASTCTYVAGDANIPNTAQTFTLVSGGVPQTSANISAGASNGTLVLSGSPTIGSGLVATTNAGTYALTLKPTLTLDGYAFSSGNAVSYTISPKALTVTGTSVAASKVYNGTNVAVVTGGTGLSGIVGSDNVTLLTQAGTFAQTGVGNGIAVTAADTLGGTAAGNYTLIQPILANANITPKALTVTGTSVAASKVYDGTNVAVVTGGTGLSGIVGSDNVTLLTQAGTFAQTGVGNGIAVTAADTLGGTAAGNYTLIQPILANANITPKAITVTADAKTKVYGNTDPSLTYLVTSGTLVTGDVLTGVLSRVSGEAVGNYAIGQGTLAASSNYTLTYAAANLVIDPRPVTLTGQMNYSGQPTLDTTQTGTTLTATNVVQGDSLTVSGTATLASAAAGTRTITAFNSLTLSNSNYTTTGASGSVTVISTSNINVAPLNDNEVAALIGSQLAALTASQIATFSTTQLQVFSWQQIAALSPSQFAALSPAQLASLSAAQLQGLSAAQMSLMTPAQLGGLTPSQFAGLNNAQLQAMSAAQVRAISTAQLSLLSPAQIALLTGNAVTPLSLPQIMALTPAQLGGMSTVQVARLTAAEVSSLSDAQLHALSLEQLAAISPASLAALSSEQIMALSLTQVASLTPEQLSSLSPTQIASLSAEEIASFDAQQLAAIGIFPSMDESDAETVVTAQFTAPVPAAQEVSKPTTPSLEVTTVATEISCTNAASANSIKTGVLSITVLSNTSANIQTAGIAFEQDASCVSLRMTSAPPVLPMTPKLIFKDKMTTFMVAQTNGQLVEFQGSLINKRLIIVAPSSAAKQIARTEMSMVLAAAITSLGAENRVVLANLDGVVIDLR